MKATIKIIFTTLIIVFIFQSIQASIIYSGTFGSNNGRTFSIPKSSNGIRSVKRIQKISIKHGRRIEKIQVQWIDNNGKTLSESTGEGLYGKWSHINLEKGEYIVLIKGRSGSLIDQLTFITNKRKVYGPFGGNGGVAFSITTPKRSRVIGFYGRSGQAIDNFGVVSQTIKIPAQTNSFGSEFYGSDTGGLPFMLPKTRQEVLSTQRIKRINIIHNRRIESIEIEWIDQKGKSTSQKTGGTKGIYSTIELEDDEYITEVSGRSGALIDQLSFATNKGRVFGPYGGTGGKRFDIRLPTNARVIGFAGRSGSAIDRIGLIYNTSTK